MHDIDNNTMQSPNKLRSHAMLRKTFKRSDLSEIKDVVENDSNIKIVRLFVLGKNEMFGLKEIMENKRRRLLTVNCVSMQGSCYFISK